MREPITDPTYHRDSISLEKTAGCIQLQRAENGEEITNDQARDLAMCWLEKAVGQLFQDPQYHIFSPNGKFYTAYVDAEQEVLR